MRKHNPKLCRACFTPKGQFPGAYCSACRRIRTEYQVDPRSFYKLKRACHGECQVCWRERPLIANVAPDGRLRMFLCWQCDMAYKTWDTPARMSVAEMAQEVRMDLKVLTKRPSRPKVKVDKDLEDTLGNLDLPTLRSKGRALAEKAGISEDCAMSRLRRYMVKNLVKRAEEPVNPTPLDNPLDSVVE